MSKHLLLIVSLIASIAGCGSGTSFERVSRSTHALCDDCGIYACDDEHDICYDWCRNETQCAPGLECQDEQCIEPSGTANGPCGWYGQQDENGACWPDCRNDTMCAENAYCAGDVCKHNHCVNVISDDSNPCTLDGCNRDTGRVTHAPISSGTDCSDDDLCNGSESCDGAGSCLPGIAPSVNDGNPCTSDSCNPLTGVAHTAAPAGTSCSDDDACNGIESCNGSGQCVGGGASAPAIDDGNSCTSDSCDSNTGAVSHTVLADGATCVPVNLCLNDTCHLGVCQHGGPVLVADDDICTLDTCTDAQGPLHHACSAIDRSVSTVLTDAAAFIFSGSSPIQVGVTAEAVRPSTITVVRTHVFDHTGAPLPGVAVTVVDHLELGSTITQADGALDMAVNGGQTLRLRFALPGYLSAERTVQAPIQDYVTLGDVVLVKPDPQVTVIDLSGSQSAIQIARGSTSFDGLGSRQATLLVSPGTEASMTLPGGSSVTLPIMSFRATEYTVGGADALPGSLPSATSYAYAVELASDEARAAGATEVSLSQPAVLYVENFMNFPIGTVVPHAYYGTSLGSWVPEANGLIVKVVSVTSGKANLDADGNGAADTDVSLASLGITDQERATLAGLYSVGQALWRVPVVHFSSHGAGWDKTPEQPTADCVAPVCHGSGGAEQSCTTGMFTKKSLTGFDDPDCPYPGAAVSFGCKSDNNCYFTCCPPGYESNTTGYCTDIDEYTAYSTFKCDPPPPPVPATGDGPGECEQPHSSTIRCQRQSLGEDLPIAGTPYVLHYESDRQRGRQAEVDIPVTGVHPPPGLIGVDVQVSVGGRIFKQAFNDEASLLYPFSWDGRDVYGRLLQGAQPVTALITNRFAGTFKNTDTFGLIGSGPALGSSPVSEPQRITKAWTGVVGTWDAQPLGLGGWSLNAQHVYDISGRALRYGNGDNYTLTDIPLVIQTISGTGSSGAANGDGAAATAAVLESPTSVAVDGAGRVYVSDGQSCVRRIDEAGVIHAFAGQCALPGLGGDGGPAAIAQLNGPSDLSFGPDGSLYIADTQNHRIRRVGKDGTIQTVAGSGPTGGSAGSFSGDGGSALLATLSRPSGVDAGIDGIVYIADTGNGRIRSLTPDGLIRTLAGTGGSTPTGNYGAATAASLGGPTRVRVASDGVIFIAEQAGNMVRRIARGGLIYPVAGNTTPGYFGDGGLAVNALLKGPTDIAVRSDGALLILDQNNTVRLINSTGGISTLAGSADSSAHSGDNSLAALATFGPAKGIRVAPDGSIYLACTSDNRVRRVAPALTGFTGGIGVFEFPTADARQLNLFDQKGRHWQTRDALTGAVLVQFSYDSAGRLTTATDLDGKVTYFNHDAAGNPTAIVGPFGQTTNLGVDTNGYLATVTDAAGGVTAFTYDANGLMATKVDANDGLSSYYYDALGRLREDHDPAGGAKILTRTASPNGFTATSTSAMGHASSFNTAVTADGVFSRNNTGSTGLSSTLQFSPNGVTTEVAPDRTKTTTKQIADPRYGMLAPTISVTTTWPTSGTYDHAPVRTQSTYRTVTAQPGGQLATVTETTNVNGQPWSRTFDVASRTWTSTSPLGRHSTMTVDDAGRPVSFAIPGVTARSSSFDAYGRLEAVSQGSRAQSFSYFQTPGGSNGYLQSATDALLNQTTYTRDALGRVLSETSGADVTTVNWDPLGNLASVTPPGKPAHDFAYTPVSLLDTYNPPALASLIGPQTTYEYDAERKLKKITRPDGLALNYSYDTFGRLTTLTTTGGTVTNSYVDSACTAVGCAPGQTSNITSSADNIVLDLDHDGSLLTKAQWSGNITGTVGWAFDNDLRLSKEIVNGASATTLQQIFFGYDNDGLLTCVSPSSCSSAGPDAMTLNWSLTNGSLANSTLGSVTDAVTYNAFGEVASETASRSTTTLYSETYDDAPQHRDRLGRIARKTETLQGTARVTDYAYDTHNRLHTATTGTQTATYEYDPNGNRLSVTTSAGTKNATYDGQDRLKAYGSYVFTYTENGEVQTKADTADNSVTTYQYDVFGNLKRVELPDGNYIEYLVDGQNRRVGKKKNGVLVKAWLYHDQLHPAEELTPSFSLSKRFIYATGKNSPDIVITAGVAYRVLSDQLGSPRLIVDTGTGTVVQRMRHDEFGNVLEDSNLGFTPFGFAGGLYDPDTGLVRFGARDYDPVVGRWTSKDPIRFGGGQTNLYVYSFGDPVNSVDPAGLTGFGFVAGASAEAGIGFAGAGVTGGGGAGLFLNDRTVGLSGGAFGNFGGFADSAGGGFGYPAGGAHGVAGGSAGAGVGFFCTNADSVSDLSGYFDNFSLNTPFFSAQVGTGGGIWSFTLLFGSSVGISGSGYPTSTWTWP